MGQPKDIREPKREMRRTGGCPLAVVAQISDRDNDVLSLLSDNIDSLINAYDDDASVNDE